MNVNDRITKILSHWDLQDSEIHPVSDTVWQAGDRYVLKQYQDPVMLERNLKILKILDERGIPVGQVIPTHRIRRSMCPMRGSIIFFPGNWQEITLSRSAI